MGCLSGSSASECRERYSTSESRKRFARRDRPVGMDLIVHVNESGLAAGVSPIASGSAVHTQVMKTEALRQDLDKWRFDAPFGGARRDEERRRAKERIFSHRSANHGWDPRKQRSELWRLFNTRIKPGRNHAGISAVELDRARCLGVRQGGKCSGRAAVLRQKASDRGRAIPRIQATAPCCQPTPLVQRRSRASVCDIAPARR